MINKPGIPSLAGLLIFTTLFVGCREKQALSTEPPAQPVRTEEVVLGPFVPRVVLHGVVRAGSSTKIRAPVDGEIVYPTRFAGGLRSGERVEKGELVARVVDAGLQHELREARLRAESALSELKRRQEAFAAGVLSEAELEPFRVEARLAEERLAAAEKRLARLELRSPLQGRLEVDEPVPEGAEVSRGTILARILGGGPRRIATAAATDHLDSLEPGLKAHLFSPGSDRSLGDARLTEVPPGIGPGGAGTVVLEVTEDRGLPPVGGGVEVEVELVRRGLAVTVPEEAVLLSRGGASLFVVGRKAGIGSSVARRRAVRLGLWGEGRVEVLEGLRAGERIIVSGVGFLTDGQPVTETSEPAEPLSEAETTP